MSEVPKDILNKIEADFKEELEKKEVISLISSLWITPLTVGPAQLARSVLVLSNGQLSILKKIIPDFYGDPRDIIMHAEAQEGFPGHYFIPTFDEIEKAKKK